MPQFKDTKGKDFMTKYNGKELFKKYTPIIGALPDILYRPFYGMMAPDVVKWCLKMGRCTEEEAKNLEDGFNALYGND